MGDLRLIGGAKGGDSGETWDDTYTSDSIVEFIDGICEGEVEGFPTADPLESIYYNDTPLRRNGVDNFEDIFVDKRLGTQSQTHFEGEEDSDNPNASLEFTVGTVVEQAIPITRSISNPNVNAIAVTVVFPGGIYVVNTKGDVKTWTVNFQIQISCAFTGFVFEDVPINSKGTINEKTSSGFSRTITISVAAYGDGPYDIRVVRDNIDDADVDPGDDNQPTSTFKWATYTEIIYAKLRYPNTVVVKSTYAAKSLSSIPKRGFILKGKIVKVPNATVYDPIARTYTGAFWDGTFVTSFTRNPLWIQYDILTNKRYGLGNEIDETTIDKWSFFEKAERCDELVDDGNGGTEHRYSLDLYIQRGEDAKKVVQDIAASYDGMVYWGNGSVLVTQDSPKDATAIFTNANVVEGKFAYTGAANQTRYTACMVQWNDPDNLYKTEIEYVEDPDGIARFGYREKTVVKAGCTSRAEAHRYGKRILVTSQTETDTVVFSVGIEGMIVSPGNVIGVRDIVRTDNKRLGGRIADGSTTTIVQLDNPVVIDNADQHFLSVVLDDGEILTGGISNGIGTHSEVTLDVAFSSVPALSNIWAVHTADNDSKYYRVFSIEEGEGSKSTTYTISAAEYNADKYAVIDSQLSLQTAKPTLTTVLGNLTGVDAPTDVIAKRVVSAEDGSIRMHVDISWSAADSRFSDEYLIKYALYNGDVVSVPDIGNSPSYRIEDAKPGAYMIEVVAKNVVGAFSPPTAIVFTLAPMFLVKDVSIVNVGVRGTAGEFFGKNAEFTWETDADAILDVPAIYSAGSGGSAKWFRDFEVKIFNDDGTTLRRTEHVTEFAYNYTYEKNVEDGSGTPVRSVVIKIKARDEFENYSIEGTLAATNNPPTSFPTIELLPSEGNLVIKFDDPTDPDYKYVRIFASQTTGFAPDDTPVTGNLIWEGSDNYISIPIKDEFAGVWYMRAQLVDDFGISGTTYTPEVSQEVFSSPGVIDQTTADEILASIADFDASNNRDASAVADPTILSDNTAIDHTVNPDGTIDVSFEWAWSGDEGTIDGFGIYVHSDSTATPYSFVGNDPSEVVWQVPAYSRTFVWRGVPAGFYYTIGVVAYRKVDDDIATNGLINSALITANGGNENPYHPPSVDPASGDITTTINGILAAHVNVWGEISGANKPFDNADVTIDQISGSGINIINGEYSIVNASEIPPYVESGGTTTLDAGVEYFGQPMIKLAATALNAQLFMAVSTTDYNMILTPNKKWLISAYVRSGVANSPGQIHIRTNDSGAYYTLNFLTSSTPNTVTRVSGELDMSADGSTIGLLRADNDAGAGVNMWFQAFMLEELIGTIIAPSAYARPVAHTAGGVFISDAAEAAVNYNTSNDNNGDPIAAPSFPTNGIAIDHVINTDGSADISVLWEWVGTESDIDGFSILTYGTATDHGGSHVFGTDADNEIAFTFPAHKRSHKFLGVGADNYYTVAVIAYRKVNKNTDPTGIIVSPMSYMTETGERPYQPSTGVSFSGDVTGTVGGVAVATVATAIAVADNYNTSNDNKSDAIAAPSFLFDGSAIEHTINTDGSADVTVSWNWSGADVDIDGFSILVYATATNHGSAYAFGTNPDEELAFIFSADNRSHRFMGVGANNYYTVAVVAYRKVNRNINANGIILSSTVYTTAANERPYRPSSTVTFSGNVDGTIDGESAATVVGNATNGDTAFDGTTNYRTAGAPTNTAVTLTSTITANSVGGKDIRLSWGIYTQGANKADFLIMFIREGASAPSLVDSSIQFNVNTSGSSYYIFQNVDATKSYVAGIAAARKTENGLEIGNIITSAAWSVPTSTANNTATSVPWSGTVDDNGNKPADNADQTVTKLAGSGVNVVEGEYALVKSSEIPQYETTGAGGTIELDAAYEAHGYPMVKMIAVNNDQWLYLSKATDNYNISITPGKKWIVSMTVMGSLANISGQMYVKTSNTGQFRAANFTTSASTYNITRVSGVIDLTSDVSDSCLVRIDNDGGAGSIMWWSGMMMEEKVGGLDTPSAFSYPGQSTVNGVAISDSSDISNVILEDSILTIARPGGARYFYNGTIYGALKITLPQSWTSTMMRFVLDVYVYGPDMSFSLEVAGFNPTSAAKWQSVTANLVGGTGADNRVRFGHDGTRCCVYIGSTTSRWNHIRTSIRDLQVSYGNYERDKWASGWSISTTTSIGSIDVDLPNSLIDAGYSKSAPWSGISDDNGNRPDNNADATDYNNVGISNSTLENSLLRISRPAGGSYSHSAGTITGVIKITLPQSWTNTMMKFTVDIFLWESGSSFSIELAGYNSTGTAKWQNATANLIGSTASDNRVRFGHDGSKCCIYIGETSSTWRWPKIGIRDFQGGYSNYAASQWNSGWSIAVATSVSSYNVDKSDALIDAQSIVGQGSLAKKSTVLYSDISVANLAAIESNLGTITAGSITGTAGIDITGEAIFKGASNTGGNGDASVFISSENVTSASGLFAFSGSSGGYGIWGDGITAGVKGTNYGSGDAGIFYNYGTGNALEAVATGSSGMAIYAENTNTSGGAAIKTYSNSGDNTSVFKNSGTGRGAYIWSVGGDALYCNGGVYINGDLDWSGTATGTYSSDIRLKDNVKTIKNASSKLRQVRGVSYDCSGLSQLGVIAQEVATVFPELVVMKRTGLLGVRLIELVGPLTQAHNEQADEIDLLKERLAELESKIT